MNESYELLAVHLDVAGKSYSVCRKVGATTIVVFVGQSMIVRGSSCWSSLPSIVRRAADMQEHIALCA